MSPPVRTRRALLVASLAALPWHAGAGFDFWTGEYTASRAELQALLERQFPRSQRYAEIVAVTLSEPQLGLDAPANRVAVAARVVVASPFLPSGRVDGAVTLGSALRYDAANRALRLQQPRVERLALQGLAGSDAERMRQIGGLVAQELLEGQVLRRFTPEELNVGGRTLEIGDITVLADGVRVQLK